MVLFQCSFLFNSFLYDLWKTLIFLIRHEFTSKCKQSRYVIDIPEYVVVDEEVGMQILKKVVQWCVQISFSHYRSNIYQKFRSVSCEHEVLFY